MTPARIFIAGALFAFIGVAAGAFGAHALRPRLDPDLLAVFETGVRYQLVHALAKLAIAWAAITWPGTRVAWSGACFAAGMVLFSGSLYALSLSGIRALGAITPFGGALLLAGWLNAAWCVGRSGRVSASPGTR